MEAKLVFTKVAGADGAEVVLREFLPHEMRFTSVEEMLRLAPEARPLIEKIRHQKALGARTKPSSSLMDNSDFLTAGKRLALLDKVAELVDENWCGRSEMCKQSASLLHRAFGELEVPSRTVIGSAVYYDPKGKELWRWEHAWVRLGEEVVDGNVDSMDENILVPQGLKAAPYWGPITGTPPDRQLRPSKYAELSPDPMVEKFWWPELLEWLQTDFLKT
jgi:hypothetical protein